MEFKTAEEASLAMSTMQGFQFDAKHTFIINRFSDIERYAEMDPTYSEPKQAEYTPRVCFIPLFLFPRMIRLNHTYRSISVLGSQIRKGVTNTLLIAAMKLKFIGTVDVPALKLHIPKPYVFSFILNCFPLDARAELDGPLLRVVPFGNYAGNASSSRC